MVPSRRESDFTSTSRNTSSALVCQTSVYFPDFPLPLIVAFFVYQRSCQLSSQWRNEVKPPTTTLVVRHPSNPKTHTRVSRMGNNHPSTARTMRRLKAHRQCSSRMATNRMAMATTNKPLNKRSSSTSPSTTTGGRDCSLLQCFSATSRSAQSRFGDIVSIQSRHNAMSIG